jgi:hypothetical protein
MRGFTAGLFLGPVGLSLHFFGLETCYDGVRGLAAIMSVIFLFLCVAFNKQRFGDVACKLVVSNGVCVSPAHS